MILMMMNEVSGGGINRAERTPEVVAVSRRQGLVGGQLSTSRLPFRTELHISKTEGGLPFLPSPDKPWGRGGEAPTWQRTIIERVMPVSLIRATGIEDLTDDITINLY